MSMANGRRRAGNLYTVILCCALALLLPSGAWAHTVQLFVYVDGAAIRGVATFFGGTAVAQNEVSVTDRHGREVARLTTDDEGRFVYTPESQQDYVFTLETGDGHRVSYEIMADWLATTAGSGAAGSGETGGADLMRIEARLDSLEKTLRLRDVLGGLGYIAGIMGLLFWWKARQRLER